MPEDLSDVVDIFMELIRLSLKLLIAVAMLVFVWGIAKYIYALGGDTKGVDEGKSLMKWGLLALFVLYSFYFIIAFFYNDIGFARPFGFPTLPIHNGI